MVSLHSPLLCFFIYVWRNVLYIHRDKTTCRFVYITFYNNLINHFRASLKSSTKALRTRYVSSAMFDKTKCVFSMWINMFNNEYYKKRVTLNIAFSFLPHPSLYQSMLLHFMRHTEYIFSFLNVHCMGRGNNFPSIKDGTMFKAFFEDCSSYHIGSCRWFQYISVMSSSLLKMN